MNVKLVNKYKRIKDISERRRVFAEDLVNFYNLKNQSFSIQKRLCFYAPAHAETPGCAIGRCLPVKLGRRLDKLPCSNNIYGLISRPNITLPTWLTEMGVDFLAACQNLHDDKDYWTETGLSLSGRRHYERCVKNLI
jgi:hypothetical protein